MKTNQTSLKDRTIAVTGGCGFIGSHLIERLLEQGVKKIVVLDSLEYGKIENIEKNPRIEFIKFKLGTDSPQKLEDSLRGVDYLFHLAAEKHNQSKDDPEKVQVANIIGTYHLFNSAVKNSVKKVVFTSSLYAYGRIQKPVFKETDIPTPNTIYGLSKVAGENLLRFFNKQNGLQYVTLRYMFVYGPKQYSNLGYKSVIVSNFNKILENKRPTIYGDGTQTYDYIYVDDIVRATIQAMTCGLSGEIFNVGTSKAISIKQLTSKMLHVAKSNLKPEYCPPDWTEHSHRVADTKKIQKVLGFHPTVSLDDGLLRTYNWIVNNKK